MSCYPLQQLPGQKGEHETLVHLFVYSLTRVLPGWLPSINGNKIEISNANEEKYFGVAAKADFYNQFRAMNRQKLIFSGTLLICTETKSYESSLTRS